MDFIKNNIDLTSFNTMGFAVQANRYCLIRSARELTHFFQLMPDTDCFILAGGSNLVLTQDIKELVIHIQMQGIAVYEESEIHVLVGVQAGHSWHEFVMTCVEKGWMGVENLALIPGTVGASPVQNIGAYGVEVKDCIHKVKAWDRQLHCWAWLDHTDCQFTYRDSLFKHSFLDTARTQPRYVISKVFFKLLKDKKQWSPKVSYGDVFERVTALSGGNELEVHHVAQAIIEIRSSKLPDPKKLGNAGSFFKNPIIENREAVRLKSVYPQIPTYSQDNGMVKIAAGWLIEQAGFKGVLDGHVGVYEKQALVLVHYGDGSGGELMTLAQRISGAVLEKFGILIEPEPIIY